MTSHRPFVFFGLGLSVAIALGAAACGSDSPAETTGGGGETSSSSSSSSKASTSTGSDGGGGSNAGGGGSGGDMSHAPIDAPEGEWTFVDFPTAVCMNGDATGIGINKTSASDDVLIFLQGGNACFNLASCGLTAHLTGFTAADLPAETDALDATPFFSRTTGLLKDYSYVYVPYCTGDTHAGDNVMEVGGEMRTFKGARNMDAYLARIVATFPNAHNVVVSGSSAGGFGAAFNYDRVAKAFGNGVKVTLLDDSGPPMGTAFVPPCLQKAFADTWGLRKTLPADCTDCTGADGVFMEPLVKYIADTYGAERLGLISSTEDHQIKLFWGYGYSSNADGSAGAQDCGSISGFPATYPLGEYGDGLKDLRDRIVGATTPNFKTFYIDGTDGQDKTRHVWLLGDTSQDPAKTSDPSLISSNGVTLLEWETQLFGGDAAWDNVGAP